jgi:hypothetical protein
MPRNRRHKAVRNASAEFRTEPLEVRSLLTQLVPVSDTLGTLSTAVIAQTEDEVILLDNVNDRTFGVATYHFATGEMDAVQQLPGGSLPQSSDDGKTLLSFTRNFVLGQYGSLDYYLHHRNVVTGQLETTATYHFEYSEEVLGHDQLVTRDGAYVQEYRQNGSVSYFLPWQQAAAPETVIGYSAGQHFILQKTNGHLFLTGTLGSFLLTGDGSAPLKFSNNRENILGMNGNHVMVSRYTLPVRGLVAIDVTTGMEEVFFRLPTGAAFSLLSENGGPNGAAVLTSRFFSASGSRTIVLTTDGTADGTRAFTAPDPFTYRPEQPPKEFAMWGTDRLILTSNSTDLQLWDLTTGDITPLPGTNPFGLDDFRNGVVVGNDLWFLATPAEGGIAVFRTDGITTELVYRLETSSYATLITSGENVFVLTALRGFETILYRIDAESPDPARGPEDLSAVLSADEPKRLLIQWSPVADAQHYEVEISRWNESGVLDQTMLAVHRSATLVTNEYEVNIEGLGIYAWLRIHVRSIMDSGLASLWSTTKIAVTDDVVLPSGSEFLIQNNELRLGFSPYVNPPRSIRVFASHMPGSAPIFSASSAAVQAEHDTAGTPFSDLQYYVYVPVTELPDGDYTVEFYRHYIDPFPDTRDLSLPLRNTFLPVSIRNGAIQRNPTELNVEVAGNDVELQWDGTLNANDNGFEVWVNDLSRGLVRVVHESIKAHSLAKTLPPGQYRGWVGLKNPATGVTHWSAAKDFFVFSPTPVITGPGASNWSLRPVISWTGNSTSRYEVWLSNLDTGGRISLATVDNATSWKVNQDLLPGQYAVWVRELDGNVPVSAWSPRHIFAQLDPPLNVTGGLNPGLDHTPVLTWQTRSDALSYEIYIARSGIAGAVYRQAGLSTGTHRVPVPLGNGSFTVWVRAALPNNRFTAWGTGQTLMIGATVVISRAGSLLTWNSVREATHYELWINYEGGEQAKQPKMIHEAFYTSTSFQLPTTLPAGQYRAWVRAIRAEAGSLYTSVWSAAVSFPGREQ